VPLMEKTLLSHLAALGFTTTRIAEHSIDSLIPHSYKRGVTIGENIEDEKHQI